MKLLRCYYPRKKKRPQRGLGGLGLQNKIQNDLCDVRCDSTTSTTPDDALVTTRPTRRFYAGRERSFERSGRNVRRAKAKPSKSQLLSSKPKQEVRESLEPGGSERSEGFILADLRPLTRFLGKIPYFSSLPIKGDRKISTEKLHNS